MVPRFRRTRHHDRRFARPHIGHPRPHQQRRIRELRRAAVLDRGRSHRVGGRASVRISRRHARPIQQHRVSHARTHRREDQRRNARRVLRAPALSAGRHEDGARVPAVPDSAESRRRLHGVGRGFRKARPTRLTGGCSGPARQRDALEHAEFSRRRL